MINSAGVKFCQEKPDLKMSPLSPDSHWASSVQNTETKSETKLLGLVGNKKQNRAHMVAKESVFPKL